MVGKYVITVGR